MPLYSGTDAEWAGTSVTWGTVGPYAPETDPIVRWGGVSGFWGGGEAEWPALLYGERAQVMLDYLPDYEHFSGTIRSIMQTEGYQFDALWELIAAEFPLVLQPLNCPTWALGWWENMLSLGGHTAWPEDMRRTAIEAALAPCVTPDQIRDYAIAESGAALDPAYVFGALSWTVAGLSVTFHCGTVSTATKAAIATWLAKAIPAHLTLTVAA